MITVYHGSYTEIPNPSLNCGRTDTDFGLGFYVTESYEMAEKWACRKGSSVINIYQLDTSCLNILDFQLDEKWLDFIVCNRNSNTPSINTKKYDLLRGATADDKLFSTIEQYEEGLISKDTAIKVLNCMNIGTQICIKTEKGLENLHYIDKVIIPSDRRQFVQKQNKEDRKTANTRAKEIIQQCNNTSNLAHRFDTAMNIAPAENNESHKHDITDYFTK